MAFSTMIVGSNGQDGLILQELLKVKKPTLINVTSSKVILPDKDLGVQLNQDSIIAAIRNYQVTEIYFLASSSTAPADESKNLKSERVSKDLDLLQLLILILDELKTNPKKAKIFIASSALVFGHPKLVPQNESCPISPIEDYSLSKSLIHSVVDFYRMNYNLRIVLGILYPHESKFRKPEYLFQKIVYTARLNASGFIKNLEISNLKFTREWNCAYQVMTACIKLMDLECFENFVIGSGLQYSVEQACEIIFEYFGLKSKEFIINKEITMIRRSPYLIANPKKLLEATGFIPDGNLTSLLKKNYAISDVN